MTGHLKYYNNLHWENKDLCRCSMHLCWSHDIIPSKIKSNLNCRCKPSGDDWSNPKHSCELLPVHISTIVQLALTVVHDKNLNNWDLMFWFE